MYSDTQCSGAPLQRYSLNGATMGTRYSAVFFAAADLDQPALAARLFAAVDKVDRQMSSWKPDSDLSRLNALPEQHWLEVPKELMYVLSAALSISRESDGAFDIAVGDLVDAWGFWAGGQQLDEQRISLLEGAKRHSARIALELDQLHHRVRKRAAVTLDLSGIAKGYGVDQLAQCLDEAGITRYLVGIDGEMRARGLKPDGRAWAVAIEKPLRGVRDVMGVMELTDCAIATSGDYRHWQEYGGKHYGHTMHPVLGKPVQSRLEAVTVLAPSCMLADAWATALLVLGEHKGAELAQQKGMEALFILREGAGFQEKYIASA